MIEKLKQKAKKLKPIHYIVIFLGLILYFGIMIGIVNYQTQKSANNLTLEVTSPLEGETYQSQKIVVSGKTAPEALVEVLGVETRADNKGDFELPYVLNSGQNSLLVIAKKGDQSAEKSVTVKLILPQTTKPKPTSKSATKAPKSTTQEVEELNSSGPETLWIFESGLLAASGVAWQTSRPKKRR